MPNAAIPPPTLLSLLGAAISGGDFLCFGPAALCLPSFRFCQRLSARKMWDLDEPPGNTLLTGGEVSMLTTAVWLMLSSMLCSLHLASAGGSFPKPLTAAEERHYLELAAQGDLAARNVLIERNLRLVAHIMNKG